MSPGLLLNVRNLVIYGAMGMARHAGGARQASGRQIAGITTCSPHFRESAAGQLV